METLCQQEQQQQQQTQEKRSLFDDQHRINDDHLFANEVQQNCNVQQQINFKRQLDNDNINVSSNERKMFHNREGNSLKQVQQIQDTTQEESTELNILPIDAELCLKSACNILELAVSCIRTLDMGLLMGAPISCSPLTRCATLLNPIARLNQPYEVRCFRKNDVNKTVVNWRPFHEVHKESLQTYLDSFTKYNDVSQSEINECCNCNPSLLENDQILACPESLERLIQKSSKCRCKDYTPPEDYSSDLPLSKDIFNPNHNSLLNNPNNTSNLNLLLSAKDFNTLVTRRLQSERFLTEDSLLYKYAYFDRPVKLLGIIDDWPARTKWSVAYLQRIAGARTVPVEIGSRYTDHDWGQVSEW